MKFEVICKQEKKSFVDEKKVKREYVETRFFLHDDNNDIDDIEIFPLYREYKKGDQTIVKTNVEQLKTISRKVKIGF